MMYKVHVKTHRQVVANLFYDAPRLVYKVYKGYIVFASVCVLCVCVNMFLSKSSQELLQLEF